MELKNTDVLILGAGIGGLTAAICLAQCGAQVRVLEQAPELQEVGAGLQISPNGLVVLKALGLGHAVHAQSVAAEAMQMIDYNGQPIMRMNLGQAQDDAQGAVSGYHFIHRADLQCLLVDAATQAGVQISLGQTVSQVTPDYVVTEAGQTCSASVIVAADGLHSKAREILNPETEGFFTGQVAWRAIVPEHGAEPEVRLFVGPRRHLVTYPLRGGSQRNIVAVQERSAWARESWSQQDDPISLRQAFAGFGPEVTGLLSRVQHVHLWGLFRHPVAARWHDGRLALLGDAAHPTLPFLAQGANMALEDAWVLAQSLARAPTREEGFAVYQAARRDRVVRIVDAASRNAGNYHLSHPLVRWSAHTILRTAERVSPGVMARRFEWLYGHDVTA